ncbi:MAG: SWIM zinc finger family protein [bacterium]|jgi:hypothetical protein|nr:SWIM zinc finger family protein [bacterium]
MRKTYGEYLFESSSESILECLSGITEEDVRDFSDYKIFSRGKENYDEGMVEELMHNTANNTVIASVMGTKEYSVEFYIEDNGVQCTCDCPYDGICKHSIAALLSIIDNGTENIRTFALKSPTTVESLDSLKKYLNSISKDELVLLVMKFAPENFVMEIRNRELPVTDAIEVFRKTEKKIRKFFEDDELLYDPEGMEKSLMIQLNHLKGLESSMITETGELLLFIIRSIETAFNEGYLYIDNHYGDEYFESEDFCQYVIEYVKQLPFEVKTNFVKELDQALNEMTYDTFSTIQESYHRFFSVHERKDLKLFVKLDGEIPHTMVSRLYKFLEPVLSPDEKEAILRTISSSDADHFLSFCVQLSKQNRYAEVMNLIRDDSDGFKPLHDFRVAEIYLVAAHKLNINMDEISEEVLKHCPEISILRKIKALKGTVGSNCEAIVKHKNPEDLLTFYEEEDRMKDALDMIREPKLFYDNVIFGFYRRNNKRFPEEAEAFLKRRIEEDLANTGKKHYERIAESLDLMKRINPRRSQRIADEIRANFKKRSSLIQIIRRF